MRVTKPVALAFALVSTMGACSPPEEPKGLEKPAPSCGSFALTGDCKACSEAACCDVAKACRADSVCSASYDCLSACPPSDQACRGACVKGSSAALGAMVSCMSQSCGAKCGATCGDTGLLLPSFIGRSSACATCVTSKACATATSCAGDVACVGASTCRLGCNALDAACLEKCAAAAPQGDLAKAARAACGAECDVGKQVACVGNVAWPRVQAGTTSVHVVLGVSGAGSPKPVVGAEVRACGKVDLDCASPVAPAATTDAAGLATFDLPVTEVLGGFNGLFRVTAPEYMPTLAFYNPPIAGSMTLPTIPILRSLEFIGAAGALGITPNAERGHLIAVIQDCELSYMPGATVTISSADAGSTVGYFQGGFPTKEALATDGAGLAGGFNLPVGSVTVSAVLGGKVVGSAQALIQKQTITQISVVPTP